MRRKKTFFSRLSKKWPYWQYLIPASIVVFVFALLIFFFLQNFPNNKDVTAALEGDEAALLRVAQHIDAIDNSETQKSLIKKLSDLGEEKHCEALKELTIEGTDYQSVCRNNALMTKAIRVANPAICEEIDGIYTPSECRMRVSAVVVDSGLSCDVLGGEEAVRCARDQVLKQSVVSRSADKCVVLSSESDREYCKRLSEVAQIIASEKQTCADMPENLRAGCRDFILGEYAPGAPCENLTRDMFFNSLCSEVYRLSL